MKKIALLTFMMMNCLTFAVTNVETAIEANLNEELSYSDGKVKSISCYPSLKSSFCHVELSFFDADNGGGSESQCSQNIVYNSKMQTEYVCSTCWFDKNENYHAVSCQL